MFDINPLNSSARASGQLFGQSKEGLLVADGVSVVWKRKCVPFLCRPSAGDLIVPFGKQRIVTIPSGSDPIDAKEILSALKDPGASEIPVFEVSPSTGRFLYRVSQIAMGFGLAYLAVGLAFGIAMPSALRYASIYFGGDVTPRDMHVMKEVISKYDVYKEQLMDEKTVKFFDAIKAGKAEFDKEAQQ